MQSLVSAPLSSTNVKDKGPNGSRISSSDKSRQHHCKMFIFHPMFLSYSARFSVQSLMSAPLLPQMLNTMDQMDLEFLHLANQDNITVRFSYSVYSFFLPVQSLVSAPLSSTNVKDNGSDGSRTSSSGRSDNITARFSSSTSVPSLSV